ncbi:MAG: beta-galactosidase trimerization domain-containing protein [Lentisphaeria bacterium]|nr:beta-galactosidase trimerization domain-containing protein [Lentisphaeria bacterium]
MKKELRFRQIHLDFHTSPAIDGIGSKFDKKQWQDSLRMAHADSITCFACCHHGWSYHPTKVGAMHPGLNFNLLREQMDASHEIGVNVPIYITAGINTRIAEQEPGWLEVNAQGQWNGWIQSPFTAGYRTLCFNTPYLDYLCRLTEEAAQLFPDADGMFFDIISQAPCCCPKCMKDMLKEGYNPENEEERKIFARNVLLKYHEKVTAAAKSVNPEMNVFHNSVVTYPGHRDAAKYYSHVELESLPTGGWGYDHFPLLAAYYRTRELDFLGMTGKFHTMWGEFGGFKHPNALRYECSAMLAQGSKCSIGDQLHPNGKLDESTCRLIGAAYSEVEQKEPWCRNVSSAANIAILSTRGFNQKKIIRVDETPEIGLSRFLLESHIPFDRLDEENDFSNYKVLILPDDLRPDENLRKRLKEFQAKGGKLILSGEALLKKESDEPAFDLPLQYDGPSKEYPNYIESAPEFVPDNITTPFVMYRESLKLKVLNGKTLGKIYDPYFVRSYKHFCSHQHTPNKPEASGYDAGIMTGNTLYFAHPVFTVYGVFGSVILKHYLRNVINTFLEDELLITTTLPSQGRVTLLEQKAERRYIAHTLYANTIQRGMNTFPETSKHWTQTFPIEVIEDLNPVYDSEFFFRLPREIKRVTLEPQGKELPFEMVNGKVKVKLDKLVCHQMIVLHY